jgi:FhuF 2Fe-2S C-terminal domain
VIELVAWQYGVALAHALLDETPLPRLSQVWIGDDAPDPAIDGEHATLGEWRADLDAQLAPLIAAVNAATRRPRSALWRGVDDRIAGAIVWIAQTTGREHRAQALATQVVGSAEVRDFNGGTLHVRAGCCLYYRIPDAIKCFGCPLLGDGERRA